MLLGRYQVFNGTRVLILGSSTLAVDFARLARKQGVEVAGLVEPSDTFAGSAEDAAWLKTEGIALHLGMMIQDAEGVDNVRAAGLVPVGAGQPEVQVACDTICVAIATLPNVELPAAMGCTMEFCDATGAWVPALTRGLETSIPGVFWASESDSAEDPVARRGGA
jgi:D-hydroxyproline dehydrogenase subunit alpha